MRFLQRSKSLNRPYELHFIVCCCYRSTSNLDYLIGKNNHRSPSTRTWLLSIQFDFGNCINPSRGHPYFSSGRLLSGALIPFAVVLVFAVSWMFRRINSALPLIVLGLIVVLVTTSEILVNRIVFASEHNWFHL